MAAGPQGPAQYVQNLAVAYDALFNAWLGGSAHGTFSARSWRAKCAGKRWGRCAVDVLDGVIGAEHCERANAREAVVLTALAEAELATPATS